MNSTLKHCISDSEQIGAVVALASELRESELGTKHTDGSKAVTSKV